MTLPDKPLCWHAVLVQAGNWRRTWWTTRYTQRPKLIWYCNILRLTIKTWWPQLNSQHQAFVNLILTCCFLRGQWTWIKHSFLYLCNSCIYLHSILCFYYRDSLDSWVLAKATCFNFSIFRKIVGFCSWILNTGSCNVSNIIILSDSVCWCWTLAPAIKQF